VLVVLEEVRRALQARNANFTVDWVYRGDWPDNWLSVTGADLANFSVLDMDDFYVLPRRIWKFNMLQFLTAVRQLHIPECNH
jgi:hypothetical protein